MKRELIAVVYGKYGRKEAGTFQWIWGANLKM